MTTDRDTKPGTCAGCRTPSSPGACRHCVWLARLTPTSRALVLEAPDLGMAWRAAGITRAGNGPRVLLRVVAHADELARVVAAAAVERARVAHLAAVRSKLEERTRRDRGTVGALSPATVNQAVCAVHGVARDAWRLGLMPAEELARIVDVKGLRAVRVPTGRAATEGELGTMFDALPSTAAGARDAAILALGVAGGLRRSEIARLHLAGVELGAAPVVRFIGKGNKERVIPIDGAVANAIRAWLTYRGNEPGPLFYSVNKSDRISKQGISPDAVLYVLGRLAKRASTDRLRPHDMRRTFISQLLDAGADISTVAKLAGHAQVGTTANYDRRGEEAKRRAVGLLRTPYKSPAERAGA